MTHFATLVLVPPDTAEVEDKVTELLARYDENGEWFREGTRWDCWVVGGRMTGMLDASYDPTEDPANLEQCSLCGGTGDRASWRGEDPARQHPSGCNGCLGKGKSVKFAPDWQPYAGDVKPVAHIDFDAMRHLPTAVVTPDGEWHERGQPGWFGTTIGDEKPEDEWGREVSRLLDSHREAVAVVVDCHV